MTKQNYSVYERQRQEAVPKYDQIHPWKRMGRKIPRGTSVSEDESAHNKTLPKYANRGNERKFELRTSDSCKNLDENK